MDVTIYWVAVCLEYQWLHKIADGENIKSLTLMFQREVAERIIANVGDKNVSFSELASGVPLGGDLDYIDDGTLALAFGGRKKL